MDQICYKAIGIIESPFDHAINMPVQSLVAEDIRGKIVLDPKYVEGLKDIHQFSHVYVIYHFHLSRGFELVAKPFLDNNEHGIFAIRAPRRPNPIGISIVKIEKIVKNVIYFSGVDMVNGTPILDIKPFIPQFDIPNDASSGWMKLKNVELGSTKSDSRFVKKNL
ncbi:MAG: tRNA (N6-threonylcarbamoyladenosine(37)-N6)-methyltransferase TrmO [Bacteroidales bacterium]|nr:tRNA (N6-threonylcarbamoyladenosine(37)-N6)-methyltransferase TrmO [Bacteroidales bacterium]MCF8458455.1 tRNA (N6-threonylcarbamoyladenosine(37)-N6)-methyltransferase TrmO [Bacteroidales bacterium]